MESKTKFFGHPVHPMLIVIPLGMFVGAIVCDTLYLFTENPMLPGVAFFNISVGIIGGLLAAVFGFLDWLAIPKNTRASYIGAWHGAGNVLVVVLFAISWWLRSTSVNFMASNVAFTFSYLAIGVGLITAWLGGELVFRLNVGVDRDANLDAPNSLSSKPAGTYGGPAHSHRTR